MKVYVAGALADADTVRRIQAEVVAAGHTITSTGRQTSTSRMTLLPKGNAPHGWRSKCSTP